MLSRFDYSKIESCLINAPYLGQPEGSLTIQFADEQQKGLADRMGKLFIINALR